MTQHLQGGLTASLITPYKGYTRITLVEKKGFQWEVEICGSGKILYLYEDEFLTD